MAIAYTEGNETIIGDWTFIADSSDRIALSAETNNNEHLLSVGSISLDDHIGVIIKGTDGAQLILDNAHVRLVTDEGVSFTNTIGNEYFKADFNTLWAKEFRSTINEEIYPNDFIFYGNLKGNVLGDIVGNLQGNADTATMAYTIAEPVLKLDEDNIINGTITFTENIFLENNIWFKEIANRSIGFEDQEACKISFKSANLSAESALVIDGGANATVTIRHQGLNDDRIYDTIFREGGIVSMYRPTARNDIPVDPEELTRKDYVDNSINDRLGDSAAYTDAAIQDLIDNEIQDVKDYTDTEVQGAKDYADTEVQGAKDYADAEIAAVTEGLLDLNSDVILQGPILTIASPNGTRFLLEVDDDGNLYTTPL